MAAQIIGSVGVKQAAIARQDIKSNVGNSARKSPIHPPLNDLHFLKKNERGYIPATITHPIAIVGITIANKLFACFAM